MTCKYCNSAECLAYATVVDDGFVFPALLGGKRHDAQAACRERTLQRALRAEAEVRACCGEPEALDPWLPEGWAQTDRLSDYHRDCWSLNERTDQDGDEDRDAWVNSAGAWGLWNHDITGLRERGILAAMAAAEKALAEAQEGER